MSNYLLNVFDKFGDVIHEPKLEKSSKRIDILFTSAKHNFKFLADITCVTGKQDKDNLVVSFKREFQKIIEEHNLGGCWNIRVGGHYRRIDYGNSKPILKLVGKSQFETEIFNTLEFRKFIENIKNSPKRKLDYH